MNLLAELSNMAKSLTELRKLQRAQLGRLTKEDLIESILAPPERNDNVLLELTEKINTLVSEVTELKNVINSPDSVINKRFATLQTQIDKQAEVISRQQRFLEIVDRKERETNVIVTGVPDENESLDGATTERDKINKIWSKIGVEEEVKSYRRLGNRDEMTGNRRRAILVTFTSRTSRDKVLEKAKQLKEAGEIYSKIYVKKDVHPNIRKEWKRLWEAEKSEKERPENVGCVIQFNTRERKLYRDGVVIDSWKQEAF